MKLDAERTKAVDDAMLSWQQGDVIVSGAPSFFYMADLEAPLTDLAEAEAASGFSQGESFAIIATQGEGLVVVSQTCDLLKPCRERPYAQVAALRKVDPDILRQVESKSRPSFAFIPALRAKLIVADLDQIMTIEKSILAGLPASAIIRGLNGDDEVAAFSECLARRFSRFAFPDDFVAAIEAIRKEIVKRHKAPASKEGRAFHALREIRVRASPSWDDVNPETEFLFVLNQPSDAMDGLDEIFSALMKKFKATGVFKEPRHRVVSLLDLTAHFYLGSQRLDLDNLSRSRGGVVEGRA